MDPSQVRLSYFTDRVAVITNKAGDFIWSLRARFRTNAPWQSDDFDWTSIENAWEKMRAVCTECVKDSTAAIVRSNAAVTAEALAITHANVVAEIEITGVRAGGEIVRVTVPDAPRRKLHIEETNPSHPIDPKTV